MNSRGASEVSPTQEKVFNKIHREAEEGGGRKDSDTLEKTA